MGKLGLYGKYIIAKADGSPIDPSADYFVLRLDSDPRARHAARTYARDIEHDNPGLATDLRRRCAEHAERALKEQARELAEALEGETK